MPRKAGKKGVVSKVLVWAYEAAALQEGLGLFTVVVLLATAIASAPVFLLQKFVLPSVAVWNFIGMVFASVIGGIIVAMQKKANLKLFVPTSLLAIALVSFFLIKPLEERNGLATISLANKEASRLDKLNIEMTNTNPLQPDYTAYYKKIRPSFFGSRIYALMASVGLSKPPLFSPATFRKLLKDVLTCRMPDTSDFIYKIALTAESRIVVWGDIQGAFDSLARCLEELKKIDIIDENYKLKNAADFLVFTGDVVSRSPMQLETLSVIFRLLITNPNNCFYLRGNHETNNYWHGFGLKQELQERIGSKDSDNIPMEKELNTFFETLPAGIYFSVAGTPDNDFIRITQHTGEKIPLFDRQNENKLFKFLTTQGGEKGGLEKLSLKDVNMDKAAEGEVVVRAVIHAEKKSKTYQDMDGMRLLPPEGGVTAWTLISCPTEVYRKGLKFFYDAFAIIKAAAKPEEFKIILHKQDVRTKDGFKTVENYLVSGTNTPPAATTKTEAKEATPETKPQSRNDKAAAISKAPAQAPAASAPTPSTEQESTSSLPEAKAPVQPQPAANPPAEVSSPKEPAKVKQPVEQVESY